MSEKTKCRCGNVVEDIKSYTDRVTKLRVTVCEDCASQYRLNNPDRFIEEKYKETTNTVRQKPDA